MIFFHIGIYFISLSSNHLGKKKSYNLKFWEKNQRTKKREYQPTSRVTVYHMFWSRCFDTQPIKCDDVVTEWMQNWRKNVYVFGTQTMFECLR